LLNVDCNRFSVSLDNGFSILIQDSLDNFKDQNEFYYVSRDSPESEKGGTKRTDDKWWLPTVKVPPDGLSERATKFIQCQKDSVNQVLKAAMAINAQILSEMEIPENYIESLPKVRRNATVPIKTLHITESLSALLTL
jgi:hypothetical protein